MEAAWRKVRKALGLRLCAPAPAPGGGSVRGRGCRWDAAAAVAAAAAESGPNARVDAPAGQVRGQVLLLFLVFVQAGEMCNMLC
ncbi:hypothetical protein BS78_06G154900 [Paspalum vaginatum]|nr:hypothetical protein BS78_06G154900 [Paspalum vaginatum]